MSNCSQEPETPNRRLATAYIVTTHSPIAGPVTYHGSCCGNRSSIGYLSSLTAWPNGRTLMLLTRRFSGTTRLPGPYATIGAETAIEARGGAR